MPKHKLFTELSAYCPRRLAYERSICHWYIFPGWEAGMRLCLEAQDSPDLRFYARRLEGSAARAHFPAPETYYAGSVSVNEFGEACVRAAN